MERALKIREHKHNVIDHYDCVKRMFTLYTSTERLTELANMADVDTICAHEHYKMKTTALDHGLGYKEFHPEHYKGFSPTE
jgi:hypothetical protein